MVAYASNPPAVWKARVGRQQVQGTHVTRQDTAQEKTKKDEKLQYYKNTKTHQGVMEGASKPGPRRMRRIWPMKTDSFSVLPQISGLRGLLLRFPRSQSLKQHWPESSNYSASLPSVCQAPERPEQEDYKFKTSLSFTVRLHPKGSSHLHGCESWRWRSLQRPLHTHDGPWAAGLLRHTHTPTFRSVLIFLSSFLFLHYILERLPQWATT